MKYRADIDGLRAIAVSMVVLFHARFAAVPGGYIGVDVFFVISGFLITTILRQDIEGGTFSISQFYERRIRRIFPATFLVLVVTAVVSSFVLMPKEFKELGSSLVACLFYASNIYFWRHTGYFDSAGELSPLLHTWSLAVEEQFYLFVPLFLYFVMRGGRNPQRWVLLLCLASLIANLVIVRISPASAFFFPFTRAWELFAGSILAYTRRPGFVTAGQAEIFGVVGLLLIVIPGLLYTGETKFPGEAAIPPVLGTALIIAAGTDHVTWLARWLANRFLVAIGKISFSLYLWHWPVFVLMRYVNLGELSNLATAVALLLTVSLSIGSYFFVEVPFRRPDGVMKTKRAVFGGGAVASLVLLLVASGIWFGSGLPQRFNSQTRELAMAAFDINQRRAECDSRTSAEVLADAVCRLGDRNASRATFAVLGDSFGDALVPGFDTAGKAAGRQGLILTSAGCYPLQGINMPENAGCRRSIDAAIARIVRDDAIETVFIVGRWTTAVLGTRFGYGVGPTWFIRDDESGDEQGIAENVAVLARALKRTLAALKLKHIVFVAYIPEQRYFIPQAAGLASLFGRSEPIAVDRKSFDDRQRKVHEWLDPGAKGGQYAIVDIGAALCGDASCAAVDGGRSLYFDDNHFSATGANYLSPLFQRALQRPSPLAKDVPAKSETN